LDMDAQSSLLSLSFSLGSFLPAQNQKNKFSSFRDSITQQKALGKRSLAPVAVVRLLLGGEDSRTRGERARFRVHGKGRHILTILLRNERRARKVTREISFHRLATALVLPLEYFFPFFFTRVVVVVLKNEW